MKNIKYEVNTSAEAWTLLRAFEAAGVTAGYPSLKPNESGNYTVAVVAEDVTAADAVYVTS